MFEELSEKLDSVLGRFRQRGLLTEDQVREGLREVRRVLLEADVNFQLTKDFLTRVEEKATGEKVIKSVVSDVSIPSVPAGLRQDWLTRFARDVLPHFRAR